ncbi:MAG: phage tail tip lysozyme [Solirubrobacteraceae bacterium]
MASRTRWGATALGGAFFALLGVVLFLILAMGQAQQCDGTAGAPSAPPAGTQTEAQIVRYLQSQGFSAIAAAGIVGNLQQESTLNPTESGGGLAQWSQSWYAQMAAWAAAHGLSPASMAGQLEYLVFDVRSSYPQLLSELGSATSPAQAATMFETTYELCSGYVAYMVVIPGSLCNDPARRQYAAAALNAAGGSSPGATAVQVSLGGAGACCPSTGSVGQSTPQPVCAQDVSFTGKDPIPGFTPSRDDAGVDACATPGMAIYAPATSVLIQPVLQDWYTDTAGLAQPFMLFKFVPPLASTYQGDEYWYVAEQITPVTEQVGTVFQAGQPVARFAPSGSCIEIGWGSPTTNMRALEPQYASVSAGELTPGAEAFKRFFGIPWAGQSP